MNEVVSAASGRSTVIGGLILAAGEGTRFGDRPKLLEPLDGRPLLEHAIEAQSQVRELARIVVVLGARAPELLAGVNFGRAEPYVCDRWKEGMSASLRCGAMALGGSERVIVTLGDVPSIMPEVIRRFLDAPAGTRAAYEGKPGHPVVLGAEQLERLRSLKGDQGARSLLAGQQLIECSDLSSGRDVDTTADMEAIRHATREVL
jgi:CTP:molybdopterin cytidylyltransferase MocA